MTILTNSRASLDKALDTEGTTLFLILDDPENAGELVHDKAVAIASARPWRNAFLITDPSLLTAKERKLWFDEAGYYAVVGGKDKVVAVRGPLDALIMSNGAPSAMEIRWSFNQGDLLP